MLASYRHAEATLDVLRLDGEQVAQADYFLTAELLRRWGADSSSVGAEVRPVFGLRAELEWRFLAVRD
jgi:hypothetical protein